MLRRVLKSVLQIKVCILYRNLMNFVIAEVTTQPRLRLINRIWSRFSTISYIAAATVIATYWKSWIHTQVSSQIWSYFFPLLHKIENQNIKKNIHTYLSITIFLKVLFLNNWTKEEGSVVYEIWPMFSKVQDCII